MKTKIILLIALTIIAIISINVGSANSFPSSMIVLEGISVGENRTFQMAVKWGSLEKELTVTPNISKIDVEFHALNIRSPIEIKIQDCLLIIFKPSPIHGYTLEKLMWNSSIINFKSITIKEVLTLAKIQFVVVPPPKDVRRLSIGGEDVEFNISSTTVSILSPVFADPHGPLTIEFEWENGSYKAMMMVYQDDVVIEGEVNGAINSLKALIYPSIQIMEFQFSISPVMSSHALLRELKKVSIAYEVTQPENEYYTSVPTTSIMSPQATSQERTQTTVGDRQRTTNNPSASILQRLISAIINNIAIVILLVLLLLFLYALFRSKLMLILAFIVLAFIIMVIVYGSM